MEQKITVRAMTIKSSHKHEVDPYYEPNYSGELFNAYMAVVYLEGALGALGPRYHSQGG